MIPAPYLDLAAENWISGSVAASGNVLMFDTQALDASATYTVCYAETGGIQSSLWRDSGLCPFLALVRD